MADRSTISQPESLVYQTDFWDAYQWDRFLSLTKDKELRTLIAAQAEQLYSFPQFALEIYTSFYKAWGLKPVDQPLPENEWAWLLFEALEDSPRYNSLKKRVGSDFFLCGVAATAFVKELADRLPQPDAPLSDPNSIRKEVIAQKQQAQRQSQQTADTQTGKDKQGKPEAQKKTPPKAKQPSPQEEPAPFAQEDEAGEAQTDEGAPGNQEQDEQSQPTDQSGAESQPGAASSQSEGSPSGEAGSDSDVVDGAGEEGSEGGAEGAGQNASETGQEGEGSGEGSSSQPQGQSQSQGGTGEAGETSGETSDGNNQNPDGDATGRNQNLKQQAEAALSGDRQDPDSSQTPAKGSQTPITLDPQRLAYIQKLVEQGKAARAQMQDFSEQVNLATEEIVSAVLSMTNQAVETAEAMMDGFSWGVGGGDPKRSGDLETKLMLHKKFLQDEKIRRICDLAGRLKKEAAQKMQVKSRDAKTSLEDVITGNDLLRLVGSEYLNLYVPALRPLFHKRYAEHSLLQKQMSGEDLVTEGPIVFLKDISGSTKGWINEFISALSMAFLGIAAEQRRHFRLVQFDDRKYSHYSSSSRKEGSAVRRVDDFKPGETDFKRLLEACEFFTGGGTNWMDPLDSALDCIQKEVNYQEADIILCTDGECAVDSDWLKEFKRKQEDLGFTIFGIIVGDESARNLTQVIPEKQILRVGQDKRGEIQTAKVADAFAL